MNIQNLWITLILSAFYLEISENVFGAAPYSISPQIRLVINLIINRPLFLLLKANQWTYIPNTVLFKIYSQFAILPIIILPILEANLNSTSRPFKITSKIFQKPIDICFKIWYHLLTPKVRAKAMPRTKKLNLILNYADSGYYVNDLGPLKSPRFELYFVPDKKVIMKSDNPLDFEKKVWKDYESHRKD